MNLPRILTFVLAVFTNYSLGDTGPVGKVGACSRVIGPLGSDGKPIGFTCEDVSGNALLIWNSSAMSSNMTVTGGIKTVNFMTSSFTISGSFSSDGPVAFIGNRRITITGSIIGSDVLLASLSATDNGIKTSLLSPTPSRLTSKAGSSIIVGSSGKVTATRGHLVVAASNIINQGSLTASNGDSILITGTQLEVGWDGAKWHDGVHTASENHSIDNSGSIEANNAWIEAHRTNTSDNSIFNSGKISVTDKVTFVTAHPGAADSFGNYDPGSFGVSNTAGEIYAAIVVISPYYKAAPGGTPDDRTFRSDDSAHVAQLQIDLGGQFHRPTQDNTPAGATSVVNTTTSPSNAPTTTSNLVIPQLAVSVTHMNSTSAVRTPIAVASNNNSEVVRGVAPANASAANKKPRVKAKPVLIRGGFFNSKISAKITASR